MRSYLRQRKRTIALILAVLFIGLMYRCTHPTVSWTEEVQLSDGQVIRVKRTAAGKPYGEIGGGGGWKEERLTVEVDKPEMPDKPPALDTEFVPIILDRDKQTRQWFAVATSFSCGGWYRLGRPKLPYTEFRVQDGKWVQFELAPSRIGATANLLTSI